MLPFLLHMLATTKTCKRDWIVRPGGAFTTLATYFLKEKDAVIFGAAFDRNCNVKHIRVDTLDDLGRLRGSKYPQSNVCNSFLEG